MNNQEAIQILKRLKMRCEHLRDIKRNGRPSELAMTRSSYQMEMDAIDCAVNALIVDNVRSGLEPRTTIKSDPILEHAERQLGLRK